MAYDPYDRGDNPWRSDFGVPRMDMPRSRPSAKPGAGRVTPKKKEPPLDPNLRWQDGKISRDKPVPLPPRRPPGIGGASGRGPESTAEILTGGEGEHEYGTGAPMKRGYTLDPERFATPLRTTGPEMAITPDERNMPLPPDPAVTGGILGGPPPGAMMPERSTPVGPAPPSPMPVMNSAANNPTALRPTQTTGADQTGAAIMNYIRSQLFNPGRPVQ